MYISKPQSQSVQTAVPDTVNNRRNRSQSTSNTTNIKKHEHRQAIIAKDDSSRESTQEKAKQGELVKQSPFSLVPPSEQVKHRRGANAYQAESNANVAVFDQADNVAVHNFQPVDINTSQVRGKLVEDEQANRRTQIAIDTYHSNQHFDERSEFTNALGVDEYA